MSRTQVQRCQHWLVRLLLLLAANCVTKANSTDHQFVIVSKLIVDSRYVYDTIRQVIEADLLPKCLDFHLDSLVEIPRESNDHKASIQYRTANNTDLTEQPSNRMHTPNPKLIHDYFESFVKLTDLNLWTYHNKYQSGCDDRSVNIQPTIKHDKQIINSEMNEKVPITTFTMNRLTEEHRRRRRYRNEAYFRQQAIEFKYITIQTTMKSIVDGIMSLAKAHNITLPSDDDIRNNLKEDSNFLRPQPESSRLGSNNDIVPPLIRQHEDIIVMDEQRCANIAMKKCHCLTSSLCLLQSFLGYIKSELLTDKTFLFR